MSDLDNALVAIIARLELIQKRLAGAPEYTEDQARTRCAGSVDARRDMAFYQVGALEQICRNESHALAGHIKLLKAATGGAS